MSGRHLVWRAARRCGTPGVAAALLAYAAAVLVIVGLVIDSAERVATVAVKSATPLLGMPVSEAHQQAAQRKSAATSASHVLADDGWTALISTERYWRSGTGRAAGAEARPSGRISKRAAEGRGKSGRQPGWWGSFTNDDDDDDDDEEDRGSEVSARRNAASAAASKSRVYRTVCVRPCDGFYFPISHRTHANDLHRDARTCASACAGGQLYIHRDPAEIDDLADLNGRPYSALKTAFLFRTRYDAACKCKPHAWEQVSVDRHRRYALAERIRKGDRSAIAELQLINGNSRRAALQTRQAQARAAKLAKAQSMSTRRIAEVAQVKQYRLAGEAGPAAQLNTSRTDGAVDPSSVRQAIAPVPEVKAPPASILSVAPTSRSSPMRTAVAAVGESGVVRLGVSASTAGEAAASDEAAGEVVVKAKPRRKDRRARRSYASRSNGSQMRLGARQPAGRRSTPPRRSTGNQDWVRRAFNN